MQLNQHIQDFVRVYDDILSEDLCNKIVKEYQESEYLPAETGNGLSPENRNVDEIPICLPDHCNNNERISLIQSLHKGMEEVIKQNTELEKLHKELGKVAQNNATQIHPTGVGPSGPPTNAGSFVSSKAKATTGASKTKTIRNAITKLKNTIKKMKG